MKKTIWIHILLFIATFITCTIAGVFWGGKYNPFEIANLQYGLQYAILILTFLSAHEFGHYFAAKYHKVDTTLPYYIPIPPTPWFPLSFGTMGAVIRIREQIPTKKALFDIGVAGPLAGFIVCIIYLVYGFATLPGIEYLVNIHPDILKKGIESNGLYFGNNLIFDFLKYTCTPKNSFIPPMNEVYHYPFLNVGFFGLFVTALNLLPIGQLDGGHITYAMFGHKGHSRIAKSAWYGLLCLGLIALSIEIIKGLEPNYDSFTLWANINNNIINNTGFIRDNSNIYTLFWLGWLFWALFTRFFIRLNHPPVYDDNELDPVRKIIGWIAILIFIGSFSLNGIYWLGSV